jgi:hypothetical protein
MNSDDVMPSHSKARVGPKEIPKVEFPNPIKVEPPDEAPKLEREKVE